MKTVLLILALLFTLAGKSFSQKEKQLNEINSYNKFGRDYTHFNINNISSYVYRDGRMDIETGGRAGFEYPKGSGKTAVYQSGFLWGGKVKNEIRVGGSTYRTGIVPGRILPNGIADEPNGEDVRVYRVRSDYKSCEFYSEINDGEGTELEIREQYEKDWNEWPADWGAPFEDVNGDGEYNPDVDIPGVPGADQTIWFVCDDYDPVQTDYLYGSLPIGFEIQVTLWGYNKGNSIDNCGFRKYKLINKSKEQLEVNDLYISIWTDPDVGNAADDLIGCDSLLNLGYIYNYGEYDSKYNTLPPPAVAFQILQGPENLAQMNTNFKADNMGMTSFYPQTASSVIQIVRCEYCLTLRYYNMMQGRISTTGQPLQIPPTHGGGTTKFPFYGDPISKIGWLDNESGDKRFMVNSGPFNLAYGDTQDVIFAVIAAGADPGVDNLGAVSLLKHYAKQVKQFYDNNYETTKAEIKPEVIASAYNREVVLTWGDDIENVTQLEKIDIHDFTFQGYNVYQLPSKTSSTSNGIKIASFDVVDETAIIIEDKLNSNSGRVVPTVVQEGHNTGIERFIKINKDYLFDKPLNNGTKYHYGITAYYYNPYENTSPVTLETEPTIVSVIPHDENPGTSYTCKFGESLNVTHPSGISDAVVDVIIIDPSRLTGHEYEITFHESNEQLHWNVEDITLGEIILTDQTNITGTDEYYIVDGFRIIITQDTSQPANMEPETCNQLTRNDVFTFTTPGVTVDEEQAKLDVEKINVFPNPYYGGHGNELNQYHNYVMFNHLPQRATFRIFNLAGHLVRTLRKDDDTQFYLWDLQNENRLLAPSGLYIIYIEMPDLQKVKVLKLAIVQREVVPDRF